jgi:hypothetical protein
MSTSSLTQRDEDFDQACVSSSVDSELGAGAVQEDGGALKERSRSGQPAPSILCFSCGKVGRRHPLAEADWCVECRERAARETTGEPDTRRGEAHGFEWFHDCLRCRKTINSRWKFCDSCPLRSPLKRKYPDWQPESYDCGCTEVSSHRLIEKHWLPPDPDCVACRGTGRIRDGHHHLQKGRRTGAAPDVSIEAGSLEDTSMEHAILRDRDTGELPEEAAEFEFEAGGWHIETISEQKREARRERLEQAIPHLPMIPPKRPRDDDNGDPLPMPKREQERYQKRCDKAAARWEVPYYYAVIELRQEQIAGLGIPYLPKSPKTIAKLIKETEKKMKSIQAELAEIKTGQAEGFERLEKLITGAEIARNGDPIERAQEILRDNDVEE